MPSAAVRRMHLALRKRLSAGMGWLRGGLPHERLLRLFTAAAVAVFTAEERAAAEGGRFPSIERLSEELHPRPGWLIIESDWQENFIPCTGTVFSSKKRQISQKHRK